MKNKIIIIDDDTQVLTTLKKMLEREGYEIVTASDGKEGVRCYRENPTDLIITDLIMPEKEGIETILELRQDFPAVKIIAISGCARNSPMTYLELAENLGAQYTFSKPVERKKLLNAVQDLLK
jgi:CheY-like chemotaxis protein